MKELQPNWSRGPRWAKAAWQMRAARFCLIQHNSGRSRSPATLRPRSPDLPYSTIVPWWANKMDSEHYWLLVCFFQYQFPITFFHVFFIAFHHLSRFARGWMTLRDHPRALELRVNWARSRHRLTEEKTCVFRVSSWQIAGHSPYTSSWICHWSWHVTVP